MTQTERLLCLGNYRGCVCVATQAKGKKATDINAIPATAADIAGDRRLQIPLFNIFTHRPSLSHVLILSILHLELKLNIPRQLLRYQRLQSSEYFSPPFNSRVTISFPTSRALLDRTAS